MIRFLADENLNNDILRGLLRRTGGVDIVRAQDVGLAGVDDRTVLEWAAREARVIVTHDVSTLVGFAWERVARGNGHAGVIAVAQALPVAAVIEDLVLLAQCGERDECEDAVLFLPLR